MDFGRCWKHLGYDSVINVYGGLKLTKEKYLNNFTVLLIISSGFLPTENKYTYNSFQTTCSSSRLIVLKVLNA